MFNKIRKRIRTVQLSLKKTGKKAALILGSAPAAVRTHDQFYPYRQSSDFYYLTGSTAPDQLLFISEDSRPVLYVPKADPHKILWEGRSQDPRPLASGIGLELVVTDDIQAEVLKKLKWFELLFYQNTPGSTGWKIASKLIETPPHLRFGWPKHFAHIDAVLEQMRLHKDSYEIDCIKKAARITNQALHTSLSFATAGYVEDNLAASLEYVMRLNGCPPSFPSIVAAGPSAAVLHYSAHNRRLKNGELLLIDWGAEYKMYSADITRTIPVGGRFSGVQRDLYQIVLEAQKAAISKVRHNVKLKTVYDAAARVLTEGLHDLKILRGRVSSSVATQAFRRYFPHGIGHSLGLDTHDIGELRSNTDSVLESGMVLTIEPGLYFAKPVKAGKVTVPACGIRIEDDLLVTKSGSQILTKGFPKEIPEVEDLIGKISEI